MLLQNCIKTLRAMSSTSPKTSTNPYKEITQLISETLLTTSRPSPLNPDAISIFPLLNPTVLHHVISDPILETSKCLHLFDLLLKNHTLISFEPDLLHHIALTCRLVKERMLSDAEHLMKSVSADKISAHPFPAIASAIRNQYNKPRIVSKMFNLVLLVYSNNGFLDQVSVTFDYMKDNEIKIDERTCTMHLLALRKSDNLELCLDFYNRRMLQSGLEISVFSLTVVVDSMCRAGEIKKCREFVMEMVGRGIKPNIVTFNTIITACAKRWNFEELDFILLLMEKEGVGFNVITYKILIEGFTSFGKIEEAERLVPEMHQKGFKVETHLCNLIIDCHCRLGSMDSAISLFDKMSQRSVLPNSDSYSILISGLCMIGEIVLAMFYVNEMQSKGLKLDSAVCNTLLDCFCNKAMFNEAFQFLVIMENRGIRADLSVCREITRGLNDLNRKGEARSLLNLMIKKGAMPDFTSFDFLTSLTNVLQDHE